MEAKKQMLEYQINEFVKSTLKNEDKIDYFDINISNHNGNLQMNCTFKDKKKAY